MSNAPDSAASVVRAHRNARTLRWLNTQTAETQWNLRQFWAGSLGIPWDEVLWLDDDEGLDDESLGWLYSTMRHQIDA